MALMHLHGIARLATPHAHAFEGHGVEAADLRLHEAKRLGRDRAVDS
jgi:hypothetical protein